MAQTWVWSTARSEAPPGSGALRGRIMQDRSSTASEDSRLAGQAAAHGHFPAGATTTPTAMVKAAEPDAPAPISLTAALGFQRHPHRESANPPDLVIGAGFYCVSDPFVVPDGTAVLCPGYAVTKWPAPPPTGVVSLGFAEFSATTGKVTTIRAAERHRLPTEKVKNPQRRYADQSQPAGTSRTAVVQPGRQRADRLGGRRARVRAPRRPRAAHPAPVRGRDSGGVVRSRPRLVRPSRRARALARARWR
jgi:hypothetical protein